MIKIISVMILNKKEKLNKMKNVTKKLASTPPWKLILFAFVGSFLLAMAVDLFFSDYLNVYITLLFYGLLIMYIAYKIKKTTYK